MGIFSEKFKVCANKGPKNGSDSNRVRNTFLSNIVITNNYPVNDVPGNNLVSSPIPE